MRRWLGEQMARPWVYRITCGALFVAIMYALRVVLIALRDTGDRSLAFAIAVPVVGTCVAFGFWYDRRRGY